MLEILKAQAKAADSEEVAREAYTFETEAEDVSRLAVGAVERLAEGVAKWKRR